MDQRYTNYAFISYKREDENWAKWLQHKLEHYRLPSVLRRETPGLPKYIRPIFRDGTDLSGGVLIDRLHEDLYRSKYLIVICSPNATKSEWVNKEVQAFIDAGRQESIIPFVVNGTPHATDASEECFPKALLDIPTEKELLGINVQEVGRSKAFVRLVATMLKVRFDSLWQRHRREQMRHGIIAAFVVLLAVLAGIFVWDYNRATFSYYADYVDRWGVPEGVVPLTDKQVSHRRGCYQFEYRRIPFGEPNAYSWRLAKVSYVNSALRPQENNNTEQTDRYPIQEVEYNKGNGVVARINYCDAFGKVQLRHVLSERDGVKAAVADFIDSQEQKGTAFVGAELTSMTMNPTDASQRKSNIVRYVYERNADGYIVKQTYHSNNDYQLSRSAVSDANGVFGCTYRLDSLGRRVNVAYLDMDGMEMQTKRGVAGKKYEYDAHGNIHKATYMDIDGTPTLNEQLWAIGVNEADENGNIIQALYYDAKGKPCFQENGYAKVIVQCDERGNAIEIAYYDTAGKPCVGSEGVARAVIGYDRQGNQIEIELYDTTGNPCYHRDGYAKYTALYDKQGHVIERSCYGTDGKPCISKMGFAKEVAKYDERGNVIEAIVYGTDGKQCLTQEGFSRWTAQYDEQGNQTGMSYFGTDGKPCFHQEGYASWTARHDERGNMIERAFFDPAGNPCYRQEGYAKITFQRDERGNQTETAYYDPEGNPCLSIEGYAKWTALYDERGNRIESANYDAEGNLCLDKNGVARYAWQYDARGNRTEEAYYDAEGNLCFDKNGVVKYAYEYDDRGRHIGTAFYDQDGSPCYGQEGYAKWTVQYDERGNMTEVAYYDTEGNPCCSIDGYARWIAQFDERGNQTGITYYDTGGKPCLNKYGYAKAVSQYDELGNRTATDYYGLDGLPCLHQDGYAKWTAQYDERGNTIKISHYDTEGKPCLYRQGYSTVLQKYGERQNITSVEYLDATGLPVEVDGYHKLVIDYNNRNMKVSYTYYNKESEIISQQIKTMTVYLVQGVAAQEGLPVNSILLQWNNWKIGDAIDLFTPELERSRYGKKELYYLMPDGKIKCIQVEKGLVGIGGKDISVEQSQAEAWLQQLAEYKKQQAMNYQIR